MGVYMKKERYTMTMDFYIWADDDADAIKEANKIVTKMRAEEDNQPVLLNIHRTPFGQLVAIPVFDRENPIAEKH
jgi:hypothetical protein